MRVLATILAGIALGEPAVAQIIVPGAERGAAGSLWTVLGAGARAQAMGGAFTAVADDASASEWNPAGLARLTRPELTIVYDRFDIDIESSPVTVAGQSGFSVEQTFDATTSGDYSHAGFASVTFPVRSRLWDTQLVTQLSYRKLSTFSELDTSLSGRRRITDSDGTVLDEPHGSQIALFPDGDIYDYGLSVAMAFGALQLGITANYLDSDVRTNFHSPDLTESHQFEFSDFYLDAGFLFRWSEEFSVGAMVHQGVETEGRYRHELRVGGESGSSRMTSTIRWPSGFAAGVAWRPIEALMVAADYRQTNWSEASLPAVLPENQRDQSRYSLGGEYKFEVVTELQLAARAGWFQEQPRASLYGQGGNRPQYNGWSAGGGVRFDHVRIDIGYVHARGKESGDAATGELLVSLPDSSVTFVPVAVPARSSEVTTRRFLISLSVEF